MEGEAGERDSTGETGEAYVFDDFAPNPPNVGDEGERGQGVQPEVKPQQVAAHTTRGKEGKGCQLTHPRGHRGDPRSTDFCLPMEFRMSSAVNKNSAAQTDYKR